MVVRPLVDGVRVFSAARVDPRVSSATLDGTGFDFVAAKTALHAVDETGAGSCERLSRVAGGLTPWVRPRAVRRCC
jgi:hypothetical protein